MTKKRLISYILAISMVLALLPGKARAADVVTFDLNDDAGGPQLYISEAAAKENSPGASRTGYKFLNWVNGDGKDVPTPSTGTVYARWRDGFAIKFDFNGGAVHGDPGPAELYTDVKGILNPAAVPAPEKTGHRLSGWKDKAKPNSGLVDLTKVFTEDMELLAEWEQVFTITLDPNDGTNGPHPTVETGTGGILAAPPAPSSTAKKDYGFLGWYTEDKTGAPGTKYDFSKAFQDDTTLVAHWGTPYVITFEVLPSDRGSSVNPSEMKTDNAEETVGYLLDDSPAATWDGHTLVGWAVAKSDAVTVTAGGSTTTPASVTGVKNSTSGKITSVTVPDNTSITDITKIVDESNTEIGYLVPPKQLSKVAFNKPATLTAMWVEGYEIIFNYGTVKPSVTKRTSMDGRLGANAPTDEEVKKDVIGHTFLGWIVDGKQVQNEDFQTYTFTKPTTVYAVWEDGYAITLDVVREGASLSGDNTCYTDVKGALEAGKMPVATCPGYVFKGWYKDSDYANAVDKADNSSASKVIYQFTGNAKIYAKWEACEIQYEGEGGTVTPPSSTHKIDADGKYPALLDSTAVSRAGYKFNGWYTKPNGQGSEIKSGDKCTQMPNANDKIELYAKWTPCTIVYNIEGVSVPNGSIRPVGDKGYYPNPLPEPTRSGYTFDGWYTDAAHTAANKVKGTDECKQTPDSTGTIILYGNWTPEVTPTPTSLAPLASFIPVPNVATVSGIMPVAEGVSGNDNEPNTPVEGNGDTTTGDENPDTENPTDPDTPVTPTTPTKTAPTVNANHITVTVGATLANTSITGTAKNASNEDVAGSWQFADSIPSTAAAATLTNVKVKFVPTDTDTYSEVETTITVTVNPATPLPQPTVSTIPPINFSVGAAVTSNSIITSLATVEVKDSAGTVIQGNWQVLGTVPTTPGKHTVKVKFTPNDTTAYAAVERDIEVNIPAEPVGKTVTFHINPDKPDAACFTMVTKDGMLKDLPHVDRTKYTAREFEGWFLRADPGPDDNPVKVDKFYSSDTDLYAVWRAAPPYTITFDWNDGNNGSSRAKTDKDGYLANWPEPNVKGYQFTGVWYTEKDGGDEIKPSATHQFTGDTTLYAHWDPPYIVKLDPNGGEFLKDVADELKTSDMGYLDAEEIPGAAKITREGYTFLGWAESADAKEPLETGALTGKEHKGPATLYAVWGAPYAIKFEMGPNGSLKPEDEKPEGWWTSDDGKYPGDLPAPVYRSAMNPESKAKFLGWYTDGEYTGEAVKPGDVCGGPVTLYAKWEKSPPYLITFDPNGGSMNPANETEKDPVSIYTRTDSGILMELPNDPVQRSKIFIGWYDQDGKDEEGVKIADNRDGLADYAFKDDTVLYAHYAPWGFKFQVTFDFNLGSVDGLPDFMLNKTVDTVEAKDSKDGGGKLPASFSDLPRAAAGGYWVKDWYLTKDTENKDNKVDPKKTVFYKDTVIYAKWEKLPEGQKPDFKYASVTFMTEDGATALLSLQVGIDNKLAFIPDPPKQEGRTFDGWYVTGRGGEKQKLTSDLLITGDYTAVPVYLDGPYTVTFDPGEDGSVEPETMQTVGVKLESLPVPVWTGDGEYTFEGWYDAETGGKQIKLTTKFTADTTVYARWKSTAPAAPYTVTFDPGENGDVDPETMQTVDGKLASLPVPTWTGEGEYTFEGWYDAKTGGRQIKLTTEFTADTTVYAHWKAANKPDDPDDPNKPDDPGTTTPQPPAATGPFTITFDANGGSVSPTTTTTGSDGKLSSYPTPRRLGSTFEGWYDGDTLVNTSTLFKSDTTLKARWSGGGGSSGGSSGGTSGYTYTVNTPSNSGGRVSAVPSSAYEGERVTVTVRPNSGYEVSEVRVTDSRGREITVRSSGNNAYYFYMPPYNVTVDADFRQTGGSTATTAPTTPTSPTVTPTTPTVPIGTTSGDGVFSAPVMTTLPMPYTDVPQSAWYYTSVDYMWKRSLMGGVSETKFGPSAATSNAMIWTILARLSGTDITSGGGVWYESARSWAMSNGVSDGADPNSPATREGLVAMMWRFSGSPAVSYDLGRFADRGQIATYQGECAFRWAASIGLVNGDSSRLNPKSSATRAEVAVIMTRFCQSR